MRLTIDLRDTFVRNALADVPKVDYAGKIKDLYLQATKKMFNKQFPGVDFQKLIDDGWIRPQYKYYFYTNRIDVYWSPDSLTDLEITDKLKITKALTKLTKLAEVQGDHLNKLKLALRRVANSYNTTKQLTDALPEFSKYVPDDLYNSTPAKNQASTSEVVELFKAAGWKPPKNP